MIHKSKNAYKSIGEVAKILNLVNKKKGTLNTHTIRFWEKEFRQIRPRILTGNRRYYNCLLYTSPSPRDGLLSRMPSSA